MLAKLLSLLVHAKSGAISGVLLLGATGALVSVSASNGVTTITITEASPSPTTALTTTTRANTETPEPPESDSPKLSSSTTSSTACSDEAKALALQVQRVDNAFSGFHTDLMHLHGLRAADVLAKADATLKADRQAAVKAIHATATQACAKQDDEDANDATDTDTDANDTNDENDTSGDDKSVGAAVTGTTVSVVDENNNDESNDGDHGKTTTAPVTFTGTASAIADQALTAMQTAVDTAQKATVLTPKPAHTPEPKTNDSKKHDTESHD
ncbi:MAG TPA: hypothetical protein DCK98_13195 [Chloroflexi bacterium]|jgi:hypothetical protein|nr:hypothetical protein [Chloroflexota bacterium]HAL26165.1 hypothetical protein [Chloroflexota bacterium]